VNNQDLNGECIGPLIWMLPECLAILTAAVEAYGGSGGYLTVESKAAQLSAEEGKNTIALRSAKGITQYDLRGRAHVNKLGGGEIERISTPHVQMRPRVGRYWGNKGPARIMTHADIRTVNNYRKSRRR
jgi:hypothetical protein